MGAALRLLNLDETSFETCFSPVRNRTKYLYDDLGRIVASFDSNNHPKNIYFYHSNNRVPDSFFRIDGSPSNTDDLQLGHAHHIVLDHLGSPKLVVDLVDDSVVEEISYDEFGNVTMDSNPGLQPFGFAGGLYDRDTKVVHFGAREYDPSIGRWLSRDPIGFKGGDFNLYGYVFNDSVNYIDPSGKNGFLWVGGGLLFGGLLGYKYVLKPLIDTFENPPPNSEPDPNPSSCPSSKPSGTKKDNLFLPPSDPLNE